MFLTLDHDSIATGISLTFLESTIRKSASLAPETEPQQNCLIVREKQFLLTAALNDDVNPRNLYYKKAIYQKG